VLTDWPDFYQVKKQNRRNNMASVEVDVRQIVRNIGENISFLQPIYEAIVNSLASDAAARNKTFLDILKKG
jgi:hypothetical protein